MEDITGETDPVHSAVMPRDSERSPRHPAHREPAHTPRAWALGHQASGWLWNANISCEIMDTLGLQAACMESFSFYSVS